MPFVPFFKGNTSLTPGKTNCPHLVLEVFLASIFPARKITCNGINRDNTAMLKKVLVVGGGGVPLLFPLSFLVLPCGPVVGGRLAGVVNDDAPSPRGPCPRGRPVCVGHR